MKHRILHIVYSLYHGGAEHLIYTLLRCGDLDSFEHRVIVLASGGELAEEMEKAGAKVIFLNKKLGADPALLPRLISLIKRNEPDILHLHNSSAGFWGTLSSFFTGSGIPIVRTEHNPWLPGNLPAIYRWSYPLQAKRAARIITVSRHALGTFTDRFPSLKNRFTSVLNGIDLGPFRELEPMEKCRKWFGLPKAVPVIGTIGRFVPVKNHTMLIEAFKQVRGSFPEAHLAILGHGEMESKLRSFAADIGIGSSVSILPATPAINKFLQALDIFVLSSRSEGLPLTLLEAMACGLPVVATSVGGIPEVIDDGDDGYLVSPGSSIDLAERISQLLGSPEAAISMGIRGREKIFRQFSAEKFIGQIESIYLETIFQAAR